LNQLTTVRHLVLQLDENANVPNLIHLKYKCRDYRMLVMILGQGPICFRCNTLEHNEWVEFCRHCDKVGHSSEDCALKNSYAANRKAKKRIEPCQGLVEWVTLWKFHATKSKIEKLGIALLRLLCVDNYGLEVEWCLVMDLDWT
jgi:hypothetical protein